MLPLARLWLVALRRPHPRDIYNWARRGAITGVEQSLIRVGGAVALGYQVT